MHNKLHTHSEHTVYVVSTSNIYSNLSEYFSQMPYAKSNKICEFMYKLLLHEYVYEHEDTPSHLCTIP